MVPYAVYKVMHIVGVMLLLLSLGGYIMLSVSGSERGKKLAAITHGIAVLVILVAGFGLMARLGYISGWPLWIWFKLGIWVILASIIIFIKRFPRFSTLLWIMIPVLSGFGAFLAVYKPY